MQNKLWNSGPVALTTTLTTNILNPPTSTGGVNSGSSASYLNLKHIRIVNKTTAAVSCSFWLGASNSNVVGTEVLFQGYPVVANGYIDWYGMKRIESTQFLVGGAGVATALTFDAEGEIGVAG
jgi:hypothetical protein